MVASVTVEMIILASSYSWMNAWYCLVEESKAIQEVDSLAFTVEANVMRRSEKQIQSH